MTLFENDFKTPLEIPEKNKYILAILNNDVYELDGKRKYQKEKSVIIGKVIKNKFKGGNQDFCYNLSMSDWGSDIFLWCYIELKSRLYEQEKEGKK